MTAIPTAAAELEEWLSDSSNTRNMFDPKTGKMTEEGRTFLKNYAAAVNQRDETIAAQIREQVQANMADFLRNDKDAIKRVNLDPTNGIKNIPQQRNALYNPKALGAQVDDVVSGPTALADFFNLTWHNSIQSADGERAGKLRRLKNSFGSTIPDAGGFLIPETLRSTLLSVALETAVVRPRAMVVPMESLRVPFPAVDDTSHASSVFGGIVAYWTQEGAAATESQARFGQVVLEAGKLTVYCEVPNELISDSGLSFEAFLSQVLPQAISFYEDDAFLNGNGVGQPLGALNATAAVSVAAESGQTATTIVWENVIKMYARMLPGSLNRAVWVVSPDTFPELATMALSVGTGGAAVWLPDGTGAPTMTLLGRPVIVSEKATTLGTVGDINFVDFGYYLVGDRQAMSVTSSPHFKFSSDKTAYKVVERVDGRPWLSSAITPKNGGNSLTPFVKLATRS